MLIRVRLVVLLTVLALVALFGSPLPHVQAATASDVHASQNDLLQFTSGGHVLGFQPTGVYVASATHLLRLDFADTAGVSPSTASPLSPGGQAQPLQTVTYSDLWPGITATFQPASGGLYKSSYFLAPGARVTDIQLRYNADAEIESSGSLTLHLPSSEYQESAPIAWQEINGQRVPVEVAFQSLADQTIGFRLGAYNPAYALVVDPTLTWNAFLGSTFDDWATGIALDGSGNMYVVGDSKGAWGSATYKGGFDTFVAKLDSSGTFLWTTFLGGAGDDRGTGIARDTSGSIYAVGYSNADWTTPDSVIRPYQNEDAFVAKLNDNGLLQWHTFLGSGSYDEGSGIAVDDSGNIYATGRSVQGWTTNTTPDRTVRGYSSREDGFITKLGSDGIILWNSFVGGTDYDQSFGVTVDADRNVYVTGNSFAAWDSPDTAIRHFTTGGQADAFVAKFDSTGHLAWHTFLGSAAEDKGYAVAVDNGGNIYATGSSKASWTETAVAGYAGSHDAFVAKLDNAGGYLWHTFVGGAGAEIPTAILRDPSGNLYISGYGYDWGSPVRPFGGGNQDGFVVKLDSSGHLLWNTFLGGSGYDSANGISLGGSGYIYVTGYTDQGWGPNASQYHPGLRDAFVAVLAREYTSTTLSGHTPNPSLPGETVAISFTVATTSSIALNPTGSVTVGDGIISCTESLAVGHCSLTFATAGTKNLTATYSGDAEFANSSSAVPHQVDRVDTETTITGHSSSTSLPGQPVTISYTVAVDPLLGLTPTGSVQVGDGTTFCTASVAEGHCVLAFPTVGSRSITAEYLGDTNLNGSTSEPRGHQVNKANTLTTIAAHMPGTSLPGQPVTVNFTVTAVSPANLTPSGSVTLSDGALSCTASVADGHCSITFPTVGAKNLTASYAGDTNLNGSTSAVVPHQVNKANTTTSVTGHAPTSSLNQAYTVNWSVSINSPATGTPTGTVTVSDGSGGSCSAAVAAGQCSLTSASAGTKTLTATFSGDTNFSASSATASHEVKNNQYRLFIPMVRR